MPERTVKMIHIRPTLNVTSYTLVRLFSAYRPSIASTVIVWYYSKLISYNIIWGHSSC